MITTRVTGTAQQLTLYRGESPTMEDQLLTVGVVGRAQEIAEGAGFSEQELSMSVLPIEIASFYHQDDIVAHTVDGSKDKSTVSFTSNIATACRYALNDGRRSHGLLLTVVIDVAARVDWQDGTGSTHPSVEDTQGRRWLHLAGFQLDVMDELTRPARAGKFRECTRRDDEYLLLDRLAPGAFTINRIRR